LKILQLIQKKQYRGAEVFGCQLSNHLMALGHEVEVLSIYDGDAPLRFHGKEVKTLSRMKSRRFVDYTGWRKLAQFITEFQPDIIQANAADTLKYAVLSKIWFKWDVPLVYRNASASSFYMTSIFSKKINQYLLKRVDAIVSVSKASQKDLNKLFPFTSAITSIVPVGVEESILIEKDTQHDGKNNCKRLIHIGSFTNEKNHKAILDIFRRVLKVQPSLELHLLGEGVLKDFIEQKVRTLGLNNSVFFYGEVADPTIYLRSSDILLLPSLIEGLPAVIVEAMYLKTPVIAYNVGGISEVLNDDTGYLIEKNDESSFAEAIIAELAKPDRNKVETAYKIVSENFMNKEIVKQFLKIYKEIC